MERYVYLWVIEPKRTYPILRQAKEHGDREMIGLKRGSVRLCDHETAWDEEANRTIARLDQILGPVARDIQHIGSTSIPTIQAKPIIDIAVAVDSFDAVLALESKMRENGFYYRPDAMPEKQVLFACGDYYDGRGEMQTHFIHVVLADSMDWINYLNFRDYLIEKPMVAKAYENLKQSLAASAPLDPGRESYLKGKHDFIVRTLRKALIHSYLGKSFQLIIDRPIGSAHPQYPDLIYPVNYGYIPGTYAGDNEALDVYLLGVNEAVAVYEARIIAIVHRHNDVEDKLVAAPEGINFTINEIEKAVRFQEQYFESDIEVIPT